MAFQPTPLGIFRANVRTWRDLFISSDISSHSGLRANQIFKMNFTYLVLLRPSEIRFTKNSLASKFDNGIPLLETFTQIKNGETLLEDIPLIEVVFYPEKWEWYTLNNRRLWVLKELEKVGKCRFVKTKRIEYVENVFDYPTLLYGSAALAENRENSRSFSWKGDSLQITTRRSPCKEVSVYYDKDDDRFARQEVTKTWNRAENSQHYGRSLQHRGGRKMRRKRLCRKRFHPFYSRHHENRLRGRFQENLDVCRRRQSVDSVDGRRNSESSEYSGSEYGFHFSYTVWYKKRQAFLQRIYCVRTGRLRDPSRFIDVLYTCGVCFKSFRSKVSLNQHSEELLHWACVRCRRFFESHTALGQHKLALNHTV
ncbi:uncharacterized protein LOC144638503 [Oculina patagonica]